jgi:CheY-like chemotaxis protein
MNLISNGFKFTAVGHVWVFMALVSSDGERARLRLDVSDTGVGLPADRLDRLFKPFSQIDASITRLYGGTGLGLSIVKQLAELMGGSAIVSSEVGRGSTFSVTLDFEVISPMPVIEPTGNGRRILLVDDNPVSRIDLHKKLRLWGFDTVLADGVDAAMQILIDDDRVDLVLADEAMPQKGGLELLAALRGDPRYVAMPFVLLSMIGTPSRAVSLPAAPHAVVLKPTRSAVLARTLNSVFSGTKPRAKAAGAAVGAGPHFNEARVLVVEDNVVNQRIALHMLRRLAIDAIVASNGAEALTFMEANPVDLVLMDCQMPVMDGYTAARRIRKMETERGDGRRVPIIALTANVMSTDRDECLAAGMNEHLAKPIVAELLEACLARHLAPVPPSTASLASRVVQNR